MSSRYYIVAFITILFNCRDAKGQQRTVFTGSTPSVASVMNFTEVPVNLFTGVPNISIPIYSLPTHSRDISADVQLEYHPAGISRNNKAADVGVGWALMAGGVITKDIRNEPDGAFSTMEDFPYEDYFNDVYEYNFFGHSGKFMILKDTGSGEYRVEKQDASTLLIEFTLDASDLYVKDFTIYDDLGYKYVFDLFDQNTARFDIPNHPPFISPTSAVFRYRSAYHLTKVIDTNGIELMTLNYQDFVVPYEISPAPVLDMHFHKISEIKSNGVGSIFFDFDHNPETFRENDEFELESISIKTSYGEMVKQYDLEYSYGPRRFLSKVKEFNQSVTESHDYLMEYVDDPDLPYTSWDEDGFEIVHSTDAFGFANITRKCDSYYGGPDLFTDPSTCIAGALVKMQLPTGGSILYEFESNTDTIDGTPEEMAQLNPFDNQEEQVVSEPFDTHGPQGGNQQASFLLTVSGTTDQQIYIRFDAVNFTHDPIFYSGNGDDDRVSWTLYNGSTLVADSDQVIQGDFDNYHCEGLRVTLSPGIYNLVIHTIPGLYASGNVVWTRKVPNITKKWEYRNGLRIKKIAYFNQNVDAGYIYSGTSVPPPVKELNYEYFDFDDPTQIETTYLEGKYLNLDQTKISGEQTGYKNVKVYETGQNGYSKYWFIPDNLNTAEFYAANKAGLMTKSAVFNQQGQILSESDSTYDFDPLDENVIQSEPFNALPLFPVIWSKLSSVARKDYFYDVGSQYEVSTQTTFSYDEINRLENKTIYYGDSTLEIDRTFHQVNSNSCKNRIAPLLGITKFSNNAKISEMKTDYSDGFADNTAYLPETILSSKGTQGLEARQKNLRYDKFGNVLEMQQVGGTTTCFVWGYNQTVPVLKIENVDYGYLLANFNSEIQSFNTSAGDVTDAALQALANDFRANLPNALVTTYTYLPLRGIRTVTDPKGLVTSYEYDDFGRLKAVRDNDGNLLSTNEYNYRPQ